MTATAENAEKIAELAKNENVPLQIVGTTGHNEIKVGKSVTVSLNDIRDVHTNWLPGLMAAPGSEKE